MAAPLTRATFAVKVGETLSGVSAVVCCEIKFSEAEVRRTAANPFCWNGI
jgi:hypothetical protein